jgi:WD40 repeat protein
MCDGIPKFLIEDNPGPTFLNEPGFSSAVFSPDGRHVAASHFDGMVRIWDARTGQLMRRVKAHMDWVNHVAFIPDGKGLVSSSSDGTLRYWDISSLCTARFRARSQTVRDPPREATGVEEQTRPEREFLGHEVRCSHYIAHCYLSLSSFYSVTLPPLSFRLMEDGSLRARMINVWGFGTLAMRRFSVDSNMTTWYGRPILVQQVII